MEPPRVFVSYSHDSEPHRLRVLEFVQRLRADGVDAWIDRFTPPPPEGWTLWMERQIREARWVIIVCTETFRRRFDGDEPPGTSRGVPWEARLLRNWIYDASSCNEKVIPLLFDAADRPHIPHVLKDSSYHTVPGDYEQLLRHLRGLPEVEPTPLGPQDVPAAPPSPLPAIPVRSLGLFPETDPTAPAPPSAKDAKPATRQKRSATKRLLIVAANPDSTVRLALDREIREIVLALQHVQQGRIDTEVLWAATERDLRAAFLDLEPQFLHFCAHGTATGIHLESETDSYQETDAEALAQWLKVALAGQRRPLEFALLNFCHSDDMLDMLAETARVVVGPVREVYDTRAIRFSSMFYTGIAAGRGEVFSYHLANAGLAMSSHDEHEYGIRYARREPDERAPTLTRPARLAHTLVIFASNPASTIRLRLDREVRGIVSALTRARRQGTIAVVQRWATRVSDFLQSLLDLRPSIVHITGFGHSQGFVFEGDADESQLSSLASLASALTLFHTDVRCAVLLFSESILLARRLDDVLDFIVSTAEPVSDASCRSFSEAFYQMLGAGRDFTAAFNAGREAVRLSREDASGFRLSGRAVQSVSAPSGSRR